MAHNITRGKAAYGRGISAWHGEGVTVDDLMTVAQVMDLVNPPRINTVPAYIEVNGVMRKASDFAITVADYGGNDVVPLGQVKEGYQESQFDDAFVIFDDVIKELGACIDTAGVLNQGRTFWVLVKLPGSWEKKGDRSEQYLLFYTHNDGTGAVVVKPVFIRVVCNNTLMWAAGGRQGEYRIRHSGNMEYKLREANTQVNSAIEGFKRGVRTFEDMFEVPLTTKEKGAFVCEILGIDTTKDLSTRAKNILSEVAHIMEYGAGASVTTKGDRDTLWHTYNTITEYVDHKRTVRGQKNGDRLASIGFGSGAKVKEKAFALSEKIIEADGQVSEVLEMVEVAPDPTSNDLSDLVQF